MATLKPAPPSELDIFRRIVDVEQPPLSAEAAESILRLKFSLADEKRMNHLAAKNQRGDLTTDELEELNNFIRVGQILGILQSKARQSIKALGNNRRREGA